MGWAGLAAACASYSYNIRCVCNVQEIGFDLSQNLVKIIRLINLKGEKCWVMKEKVNLLNTRAEKWILQAFKGGIFVEFYRKMKIYLTSLGP